MRLEARRGRALLLAGFFLAALGLRPQIVAVGPLLPDVQRDLDLSHAVAGLLPTIPVLCMGLFALPAPWLARRLDARGWIALALALLGVAGVARALGINVGAATSTAVAVPLAAVANGWRGSLVVFSLATVLLALFWLRAVPSLPPADHDVPPRLPVRSALAWLLVTVFALNSIVFYAVNAWLPDAYVERGWSESRAGWLLGVANAASVPAMMLVAAAADRVASRRAWLVACSASLVLGLLGIVALPAGSWAWAVLLGTGNGALFSLLMTLPLDVADRLEDVGGAAALMLGAGYCLSGTAPFALGALRDAAGSFAPVLWLVFALSVALLALSPLLSGERLRRGVSARGP